MCRGPINELPGKTESEHVHSGSGWLEHCAFGGAAGPMRGHVMPRPEKRTIKCSRHYSTAASRAGQGLFRVFTTVFTQYIVCRINLNMHCNLLDIY